MLGPYLGGDNQREVASRYASAYAEEYSGGYPSLEPPRGPGIGSTLMKGAMMMLAFGAVEKIAQAGLSGASRKFASMASRLASRAQSRSRLAREFHTTHVAARTLMGGPPAIGTVVRGMPSVGAGVARYRAWQRMRGIDVSAYSRWQQGIAQRAAATTPYTSRASQRVANFRSFMTGRGSPEFRGRVVGSVEQFLTSYAKVLPGIFIAQKALGIFGRDERRPMAWWNLPGRAARLGTEFLGTAATFLPISLAFRGIGGAVKLTKDYTELGLTRRLARPQVQTGIYNAVERIERARGRMIGTREDPGVYSRMRGAAQAFLRNHNIQWRNRFIPAGWRTGRNWWRSMAAGYRRASVPKAYRLTDPGIPTTIRNMEDLRGIRLGGDFQRELLGTIGAAAQMPRRGFLARVLGMRPARIDEVTGATDRFMNLIRTPDMSSASRQLLREALGQMYFDRGTYLGPHGRVINVSRYMPKEVVSRAVDWTQEHFTIMGKLRPLEFFRASRIKDYLLDTAPRVQKWGPGNRIRVGPVPISMVGQPQNFSESIVTQQMMQRYDPRGAIIDVQPGENVIWLKTGRNKGSMFFSTESWRTHPWRFYQPRYSPEKADIMHRLGMPIGELSVPYSLVKAPPGGAIRRVQDNYYMGIPDPFGAERGSYQEERQGMAEAFGWGKWRTWLHSRILRNPSNVVRREGRAWPGLEIGAGYGAMPGPFRRLENLYMKYFSTQSPLVMMSQQKGFLRYLAEGAQNPGEYIDELKIDPAIKFLRVASSQLDEALDRAWPILKRGDLLRRYASHEVNVGTGRLRRLGDLLDDSQFGREQLVEAVRDLTSSAIGTEGISPSWRKARDILEVVQSDEGYWSHIVTKLPFPNKGLTALDDLQKFIFRHHLINQAAQHTNRRYIEGVIRGLDIGRTGVGGNNREMTLLRSLDTLAKMEARLGRAPAGLSFLPDVGRPERAARVAEWLSPRPGMPYGELNDIIGMMMGESQTLSDLSMILTPPWSTKMPNYMRAPAFSASTTSPYEVVVKGGFRQLSSLMQEQGTLRGLRSYFMPRYAVPTPEGIMMPGAGPVFNPPPGFEAMDPGIGGGMPPTGASRLMQESIMRLERMAEGWGMGLNLGRRTTWQDIGKGVMTRMVLPGVGIYSGYKALDVFFDSSPIFNFTALDEGLTVAAAEQYVKMRLRAASMADHLGITAGSQYLEGLMPGFVSSPIMRMMRGVAPPIVGAVAGSPFGPTVAGFGLIGGTTASALTGFGLWDLTKDRDELEDIYSGREPVPIRRGRWWSMGRTPFAGSRVMYWRPHSFARLKSQYKYTPTMYGSKLEEFMFNNPLLQPFALAADPYHWERKHYFSAPYPQTGTAFEGIPFVGPTVSSTVGRVVKPPRIMHSDELRASFNRLSPVTYSRGGGSGFYPPSNLKVDIPGAMVPNDVLGRAALRVREPAPVSMYGTTQTVGRQFYRGIVEPLGLWGWASQEVLGGHPYQSETVMQSAGERTSFRRAYWDLNLSGLLGQTELFRRFYPRQRQEITRWNPLRNRMPQWLPSGPDNEYFLDFGSGDPFSKLPESELLLPGWSHMTAHHVSLSMPFRASQLGKTYEEMVQYLTGTRPPFGVEEEEIMEEGTQMHRMVQEELHRANVLIKAEAPVYEPYSDISGTVDAVLRRGRQKVAMEIKTLSTEKLEGLAAPINQHVSQLNFYLKALGLREGTIMYMSRDNPLFVKEFPLTYSEDRYRMDVARLEQARATAGQLLAIGIGNPGEAYSHLDRLGVLANVAPHSDEYKREVAIVNTQDRLGMLTPEEHQEKISIIKRRRHQVRTHDFYPRRFSLGNLISPDKTQTTWNMNEFIKQAGDYPLPLRFLGSAWETMAHQRTPVHSKFLSTYSPREHYEKNVLYGRSSAFWNAPMRDFVEPYTRAAMATRRPDEGIIRGLQAGFIFGGPPGAIIGAGALGVWGAAHGGMRWLTDSTYIPSSTKGKWEVNEYFDKLKYLKARRLFQITGNEEYSRIMGESMVGLNALNRSRSSFTNIARAVPPDLKPYIFAFMREEDPGEREAIANEVPPEVAQLLRIKWAQNDGDRDAVDRLMDDSSFSRGMTRPGGGGLPQAPNLEEYFSEHYLPDENWAGFHPSVELDDVKLKTVERMSYDAHDFGMGWYDQQRRMQYSPFIPGPISLNQATKAQLYPEEAIDSNEVRTVISNILRGAGATSLSISVTPTPGVGSLVNLNVGVEQTGNVISMGQRDMALLGR